MTQRRGLGRGLGALIPSGGVRAVTEGSAPVPLEPHVPEADGAEERVTPATPADATPAPATPGPDAPAPTPTESGTATREYESVVDLRDDSGPVVPEAGGAGPELGPQEGEVAPDLALQFRELPVDAVDPNPRQPRQAFDDEGMAELVHSIIMVGLLQPIVVRPQEDRFELVAGERRLRAAKLAGLLEIPALIRHTADDAMLRDALLENLHRVQLNPLEEAAAYSQLLADFSCTQDELAQRVGRSRPQVANTMRLLKLPPAVQRRVAAGVLSAGHARAILGASDAATMELLAARVVAEGLSVRAVEELVVVGPDKPGRKRGRSGPREQPIEYQAAADRLGEYLETRVRIETGKRKGRIVIEFAGTDDLARLVAALEQDRPPRD
jgi:ParB family transcriptional regulator, chromosome partitioning protein